MRQRCLGWAPRIVSGEEGDVGGSSRNCGCRFRVGQRNLLSATRSPFARSGFSFSRVSAATAACERDGALHFLLGLFLSFFCRRTLRLLSDRGRLPLRAIFPVLLLLLVCISSSPRGEAIPPFPLFVALAVPLTAVVAATFSLAIIFCSPRNDAPPPGSSFLALALPAHEATRPKRLPPELASATGACLPVFFRPLRVFGLLPQRDAATAACESFFFGPGGLFCKGGGAS